MANAAQKLVFVWFALFAITLFATAVSAIDNQKVAEYGSSLFESPAPIKTSRLTSKAD